MLGVAAVELGLTMAPVLILTFGVTEYGRAIFTYNAIDKAARDAARFMTAPPPMSVDPEADARNLVVYGNVQGSGPALAPGLQTGMVQICLACDAAHTAVPTGSGTVVNLVTVRITGYVYDSIVTYVAPATLNFNDISVTMRTNL
jgi:Flp pilus assembly protein TadG